MLIILIILSSLLFSDSYNGYLKSIEISFCMDDCSMYYLESEGGEFLTNVVIDDSIINLYLNRYVFIEGEHISCIECDALSISSIFLSSDCEFPISCFADPCEVSEECELNTPVECIPNYCGGCYADFYDLGGNLVNCYNESILPCDDIGNTFFGECDMFLGYAIVDGECSGVSGCSWESDGVDYSEAFYSTNEECENECLNSIYTCEDIEYDYGQYHSEEYTICEFDNDCSAVWGHCDIGLGGCHYSVNTILYLENEINELVEQWQTSYCTGGVCDCMDLPYAQCLSERCTSAYCQEDNPAGCYQTGCDDGFICLNDPNVCTPSSCFCNDEQLYGYWYCTEDCGGGSCAILGDINSDNLINVVDVVISVNSILAGLYNPLSDMNNDNNLNVADIVIIINIILGD